MRKRPVISIVLCLALGALSTVAVAWLCAAFTNPDRAMVQIRQVEGGSIGSGSDVVITHRGFGHTRINRARVQHLDLDDQGNIRTAAWSANANALSISRAGWPLRALACENPNDIALAFAASSMRVQGGGPNAPAMRGGWELSPFAGGPFGGTWRAIPFRPLWFGFAGNIIIHAAMWWLLLFGAAMLQRAARRRAGRCEGCGYDLRSGGVDHERCPECGEPTRLLASQPAGD